MPSLFRLFAFLLFIPFVTACIGDDIVDDYVQPQIRLTNPVSEIEAETSYQFEFNFINNIGITEAVTPEWTSSDETLLTISPAGLASALQEGNVVVSLSFTDEFGETASRSYDLTIGASTVVVEEPTFRTGTIATTTFYDLEGDFTLSELLDGEEGDLKLEFGNDYRADNGLPGLFVYLSNNPNSTNGAFEIGAVQTFSGAHEYIIDGVELAQYRYVLYFCKPFNVKVGDGEIQE